MSTLGPTPCTVAPPTLWLSRAHRSTANHVHGNILECAADEAVHRAIAMLCDERDASVLQQTALRVGGQGACMVCAQLAMPVCVCADPADESVVSTVFFRAVPRHTPS